VSPSEFFQEYPIDVNRFFLTHGARILVMWRHILPHVMDERYSWMIKWMINKMYELFFKNGCQMYEKLWMTHYLTHKGQNNFILVLSSNIQHMKC
jgi:hypothetical protein